MPPPHPQGFDPLPTQRVPRCTILRSRTHFRRTDPKTFIKAPLAPKYNNFAKVARAEKTRFFDRNFPKSAYKRLKHQKFTLKIKHGEIHEAFEYIVASPFQTFNTNFEIKHVIANLTLPLSQSANCLPFLNEENQRRSNCQKMNF